MDPEHIPIILNMGIGGVLLYLYIRQEGRLMSLQAELTEVRRSQWALLVSLFGEEHANVITKKPASPDIVGKS